MDALDLVEAEFTFAEGQWKGSIEAMHEVPLDAAWPDRFSALASARASEWFECERDWSRWCATQILRCTDPQKFDMIAFSGQTIFHQPASGYTAQLGSGAELYAACGARVPVVSDLRSLDVALGGQGAPLVPVADALLFSEYAACLNLGGFSNISLERDGQRLAWDVGPCNLVLNAFAQRQGLPYPCNAEVRQLELPLLRQEHVLRLDVPVYHAPSVCVLQSVTHLKRHVQAQALPSPSPGMGSPGRRPVRFRCQRLIPTAVPCRTP